MTYKQKIRKKIDELLNKVWKWQDSTEGKYRCEAYKELLTYIDSTPEEYTSEDLEEAAYRYAIKCEPLRDSYGGTTSPNPEIESAIIYGAQWKESHLWKDAQGDDLPEVDREVVAFQGRKVVIAHRPDLKGWDGKSLSTGEVEHYTPMTYGKGGWNMPDIWSWLDAPLPEGIE